VLPGISGREVARQLCAMRPDLRVILISGFEPTPAPVDRDEQFAFFQKPFTGDLLARKIRELLDAHPGDSSEDKR
jgi:FixJ family two-component response regulator